MMKMNKKERIKKVFFILFVLTACVLVFPGKGAAQQLPIPNISLEIGADGEGEEMVASLKLLLLLTVLSLVPAILVLLTSFTRIVIVLGFVRNALATQNIPPNQVIVGLALLLTVFVMKPVYTEINRDSLTPFLEEEISQEEAYTKALVPIRNFMFNQTREKDLALFVNLEGTEQPSGREDVSMGVLTPAFIISELKTAFQIGFMLFIPFLVIDMVVASTLMSMGMFMLPPVMISLPFKLLLFIMVDGWHLVVKSLVESFG